MVSPLPKQHGILPVTSPSPAAPRHRLYVTASLAEGHPAPLEDGQAHYLRGVLRLSPGDWVTLFNGRDGEWAGEITALSKSAGEILPQAKLRPQAEEPGPWLLFAPLKKDATDYVVQKAVELGCGALIPVFTQRTQSQRVRTDRLRAQVIEASEQCERLTLPEVVEARPLDAVLADWPTNRRLFVMAERQDARPAAEVFAGRAGDPAAILVGPEGGLAPSDLDALAALALCTPVNLGPRILRAETAAAAALSVWQAVAGDWRAKD
ncbi:MAG: 16S rRNA (uracil(1498)-N(3))-methyltransferase [Rhodospirillum sp.]|nr:16S rRNA (uracil(1498)-N(3))-methyltransferase [Rhodospirillum sp.]MCF8491704.1 16S rRNA (uracil(1498)-N(3))-methyltransferase [Rhodospirillum sp.]